MKTKDEALRMALEALDQIDPYVDQLVDYSSTAAEWPLNNAPRNVVKAITAIREALAQPETVDSAEKAGAYLDARLWEFIDIAAAWPEAKPDPRTWAHVLVYAPKQSERPAVQGEPIKPKFVRNVDGVPCITLTEHEHIVEQLTTPQPAVPERKPLPPESPCEMTQAERKMFRLGWLECEAAHGIGEKPDAA